MGNEFTHAMGTIAHGLKVGAEDLGKGICWVPEHLVQVAKLLDDVIKDSPSVRAELKALITKTTSLDGLVAEDIMERGLNIEHDLATLRQIKDLVTFVRGEFWSVMSKAYNDLEQDIQ